MVTVKFLGRAADRLGLERQVTVPSQGCSIAELRAFMAADDSEVQDVLSRRTIRASLNGKVVDDSAHVLPGAEVVFFSLVSGG